MFFQYFNSLNVSTVKPNAFHSQNEKFQETVEIPQILQALQVLQSKGYNSQMPDLFITVVET